MSVSPRTVYIGTVNTMNKRSSQFILLFLGVYGFGVCHAQTVYTAADCLILPHRVTQISSPTVGVLSEVSVEKSDVVEQGQVIAKLESSVEKAAVDLAKVRSQVDSEIKEGQINTVFDKKRKVRMDSLYKKKNISEETRDEIERDERIAKARLQQAKDLKRIRKYELAGMEAKLAQKTIRAPFSGYILEVTKNVGEYVEEQPILTVAQLDPLNVEAILPIEYFGSIKPGMTANIHIEAFPDKTRKAKVVVVDPVGNAASGTFGVRLEIANPDNKLPAGLKCQAKF